MLVNLVPEFLAAVAAPDPIAAYSEYLQRHRAVLAAYWHNYVLPLDSPHAAEIMKNAVMADRSDLKRLLSNYRIDDLCEEALNRARGAMDADCPVDLYVMVGVGGANAGELVVGGRGIAFVCLEHFTGRPNPQSYGIGLAPELLAPWIAHEVAHVVRYTSPTSRAEIRRYVAEQGGFYDYWETGSRATLRELLVNEGAAVAAARAAAPGFDPWVYLGYARGEYRRLRGLDAFLRRASADELDTCGVGLRLRYLSGGMSPSARTVMGKVLPERAGYYLGLRMVESYASERAMVQTVRASAEEFREADERLYGSEAQTA